MKTHSTTPQPGLDVDLERAVEDLRRYCARLSCGRVFLTVERYERSTVGYYLRVDALTSEDVERLMREPPCKEG